MKKIFLILILSLLTTSNSFAERLNWFFSKWLSENGHHQYLNEQGSHNLNIKIKIKHFQLLILPIILTQTEIR